MLFHFWTPRRSHFDLAGIELRRVENTKDGRFVMHNCHYAGTAYIKHGHRPSFFKKKENEFILH
jgi:hypothetical protein